MTVVSFQGEHGAYSEAAARARFSDAKTLPCLTFATAVEAVESGRAEYAIIPVENSITGSVGQSYDILRTTRMRIVSEIAYHIKHCLLGRGTLDQIQTVYSHPQALAQCGRFLESRRIKALPVYDTAGSIEMISGEGDDFACIASKQAAERYRMPIIQEGISDRPDNYTRFVVLSHAPLGAEDSKSATKTSVIVSLRHETGALHQVLSVFTDLGINLIRIASSPKPGAKWEYDFFIDLECGAETAAPALEKIEKLGATARNLGSYRPASV